MCRRRLSNPRCRSELIDSVMENANREFLKYRQCLDGESDEDCTAAYSRYQQARNDITKKVCTVEHNTWKKLLSDSNSKNTWGKIDWKGDVSKYVAESPEDLSEYFDNLYKTEDPNDLL